MDYLFISAFVDFFVGFLVKNKRTYLMKPQPSLKRRYITEPLFRFFKEVLPPLSQTEKEALEAGSTWWDAELFSGTPHWRTLLDYPKPHLTDEERAFIDNQVETLLSMVNDFEIVHEAKDLPLEVWAFLKKERFFSLIIPKEYGGLSFSAYANSSIVARIATRSLTLAVTVMVPNSLGPGELITQYGTQEQKDFWLSRLADGREIPCFALTEPGAGSDASAITDKGIVCRGLHDGKEVLGIRLSWNKRYITLAPVATVLGLAFKLYDPDGLLKGEEARGITCALIPTECEGVEIGRRHFPLALSFMNGPTRGKDIFIPMDWVIGGEAYIGKGWCMLVECLSAGRGISLPALGTALGHLCAHTTGAYSYVRKQFGMPIGKFEGVAQALGRIGGYTYMLEAARGLTTTALDMKEQPGVVTAIAKYHMTELARKVLNDAMDIHAGRAIQLGPLNYLGNAYFGVPVSITVEGANILTRNLIIFGQGALRCHPYILKEMQAVMEKDEVKAKDAFEPLLMKHLFYSIKNVLFSFVNALTRSRFNRAPVSDETAQYYRFLSRMSRALSVSADVSMLMLGGDLKRREMLSARLGDILSHLYLASAVLKRYEDDERQETDLPFVHYSLQYCLNQCALAFDGVFDNFPKSRVGGGLRAVLFPLGMHFKPPSDALAIEIANLLMIPGAARQRLTSLCYVGEEGGDPVAIVDRAFYAVHAVRPLEAKINCAMKQGFISTKDPLSVRLASALAQNILTQKELEQIKEADLLREKAIQVDDFDASWFRVKKSIKKVKNGGRKS